MPQTLKSSCTKSVKLFPSAIEQSQFSKDMMETIRSASWRTKIERMSYRPDHQDKTPGLVSFQQLLITRDLQCLGREVIRFMSYRVKGCRMSHRHRSHHKKSDLSSFRQLLSKCSF